MIQNIMSRVTRGVRNAWSHLCVCVCILNRYVLKWMQQFTSASRWTCQGWAVGRCAHSRFWGVAVGAGIEWEGWILSGSRDMFGDGVDHNSGFKGNLFLKKNRKSDKVNIAHWHQHWMYDIKLSWILHHIKNCKVVQNKKQDIHQIWQGKWGFKIKKNKWRLLNLVRDMAYNGIIC